MAENLLDSRPLDNGRDDPQLPGPAIRTVLHVDIENPPEQPRPADVPCPRLDSTDLALAQTLAAGRGARIIDLVDGPRALRHHLRSQPGVRGQHTVVANQVQPRSTETSRPLEHPDDLKTHRALVYTLSASPERWRLTRDRHVSEIAVRAVYGANNSLAIREALLGGVGLALIPRIYVEDALRDGRLISVLDDWKSTQMWVYALFPADRHMPRRTRAFVDFLIERLTA